MAAHNEEPLDDEINPLQIVADFLTQAGWPCEQVGEEMLLKSTFKGNSGEWVCYAHCRPQSAQTLFYSVAPLRSCGFAPCRCRICDARQLGIA